MQCKITVGSHWLREGLLLHLNIDQYLGVDAIKQKSGNERLRSGSLLLCMLAVVG